MVSIMQACDNISAFCATKFSLGVNHKSTEICKNFSSEMHIAKQGSVSILQTWTVH